MQKRMDLTSQDLELILVLISNKTLTAAAKEKGVGQSTLSRQLEALELKLDLALFSRHRTGIIPNLQALELGKFAEQIDLLLGQAKHKLQNSMVQPDLREVHISCPDTIAEKIVSARVAELIAANPGLSLRVTATEKLADLGGLECDIALRLGAKPGGDCTVQKLMSSPIRFFGKPKYLQGARFQDLTNLPIIIHDTKSGAASKINKILPSKSVVFKSNRLTACLEAAQAGAGILLLPSYFGNLLPELSEIPIQNFPKIDTSLYMSSSRAIRKEHSVAITWSWLRKLFV
jgi:DNA-binding transcriptional LysR family regulator